MKELIVKEPTVYEFGGMKLSPFLGPDGKPWFFADEVCEILGIKNVSQAVEQADLDEDEKGISSKYTKRGLRPVLIVSESGLYGLIGLSRKPIARKFRKWIRKEVLPSLRGDGFYRIPDRLDALPLMQADVDANTAKYVSIFGRKPRGGLLAAGEADVFLEVNGVRPTKDSFALWPPRPFRCDA